MSVLVTGGAGYIGGVAVEQLIAAGEQVVVLDNLSTGNREAIAPEAVFVEGSTLDGVLTRRLLKEYDIDTVMHFAADIAVGESCINPGKYFENNTAGALALLRAMTDCGVTRFIFSSTAAVYGDPEAVPITEDMPIRPINPYGLSKRMVEEMLTWFDKALGLKHVALRYFNACGASVLRGEAHEPETHLIPLILMAADGTRDQITIYGNDYDTPDGTCIRDYIHILDLADAHVLAMKYLRQQGESLIVNLGNGEGHSVLEVIASVKRVTGCDVPLTFGERRAGDADRLVASSEKARRVLGWKPLRGNIDEIVRDAWHWRKAHPKGYKV